MASEPREHANQLPLYNRSSDRDIYDCPGRWLLSYLEDPVLPDAGWFILGDVIHKTIEQAVLDDLTLEDAVELFELDFEMAVALSERQRGPVMWSSKRDYDGCVAVGVEALRRWYNVVHPDGAERIRILDEYQWPPHVEVTMLVPPSLETGRRGIRTEADAVFVGKRKGMPNLIVDWKTGSKAHANETQLHFYYWAGVLSGKVTDKGFRGGFVHLGAGKEAKWQEAGKYPGDLNMKAMAEAVTAMKDTIREGNVMFRRDWWCGSCRAREVCPVEGSGDIVSIRSRATQAEWIEEPIEGWENT